MSDFVAVIPARLGSTRLPRKVLRDLAGKPLVQHVWEAARRSGAAQVLIATDAEEVRAVCSAFGAEVRMTRAEHQSGTDRIQEVAQAEGWGDDRIVVNVQGDEPLMPPALIRQCADELAADTGAQLSTLAHALHSQEDWLNPNVVKLVRDEAGRALYFSRAPIPWPRDGKGQLPALALRHIGLYGYRVSALRRFSQLPSAALEQCEALEQLRALAAGLSIRVGIAAAAPPRGVDTEADLAALAALMREHP